VLNQLVTEMGMPMDIVIYALLKTSGAASHETIIVFLFEQDDQTGQM